SARASFQTIPEPNGRSGVDPLGGGAGEAAIGENDGPMCGICGDLRFDGRPADIAMLERMTATMAPRGPDSGGVVVRGRVGLGHRRLKIIDLTDKAEQPMV